MYEGGPFDSDVPVPVAVESFHAMRPRSQTNLLNWDGKGAPAGIFPEKQQR
jgi:nitrate reductase beta subunit